MATRALRGSAPLEAYVLHRHDWSESSLILDLYTREQGRLAVAAKGAKRPHSQLRSALLPFQRLHVTLGRASADAAAEVQTLRSAEWAGGAPMLSGDALFSGFYCNELLLKLLARGDPHAALFDAYAETLPLLGSPDESCALRSFELSLLRETGVLPDLSLLTSTQQPLQASARYTFGPEAGISAVVAAEPGIRAEGWRALQAALERSDRGALRAACRSVLPELRSLLRASLQYHLGSATLRTRQVMLDAQRMQDS